MPTLIYLFSKFLLNLHHVPDSGLSPDASSGVNQSYCTSKKKLQKSRQLKTTILSITVRQCYRNCRGTPETPSGTCVSLTSMDMIYAPYHGGKSLRASWYILDRSQTWSVSAHFAQHPSCASGCVSNLALFQALEIYQ